MTAQTFAFALFIIASFALAYSVFDILTDVVVSMNTSRPRPVKYTMTMYTAPAAFTYIMGYMFIPF